MGLFLGYCVYFLVFDYEDWVEKFCDICCFGNYCLFGKYVVSVWIVMVIVNGVLGLKVEIYLLLNVCDGFINIWFVEVLMMFRLILVVVCWLLWLYLVMILM